MEARSPISNIFHQRIITSVWTFCPEKGEPIAGVLFDETGFIDNPGQPEQHMWRLVGNSLEIFDRQGNLIYFSTERSMEGNFLCLVLEQRTRNGARSILREAGPKGSMGKTALEMDPALEKPSVPPNNAEEKSLTIEAVMAYAALTYVYNEKINLPIWVKYYGKLFGEKNLFVIDRESDDGSTENLGAVNVIRVPRTKFDEADKSGALSSFHAGLLRSYEAVVCTDCDEILIPDPAKYRDLNDYIVRSVTDYSTGLGLNVVHAIDREPPLDLSIPILRQRKYASFTSTECKTLISKVPLQWAAGLHYTKLPPKFDRDLFVFHLKLMDYSIAVGRQSINQSTAWSQRSMDRHHGNHHRFDLKQFMTDTFLSALRHVNNGNVFEFEFEDVIEELTNRVRLNEDGFHEVPFGVEKMITIPDRFAEIL